MIHITEWQAHDCLQSTCRHIAEHDCAAVRLNDCASDCQPEADAAGISVARPFQPYKRFKDRFKLFFWQSQAFVRDSDDGQSRHLVQRHHRYAAIANSIVDQVP